MENVENGVWPRELVVPKVNGVEVVDVPNANDLDCSARNIGSGRLKYSVGFCRFTILHILHRVKIELRMRSIYLIYTRV